MKQITEAKREKLIRLLVISLWTIYFILMIMIARDLYQNFKDIHYNIACMCLIVLAMSLKKDFRLNWVSLIPAGAFTIGGLNYIYDTRFDWGREYKLVLLTRFCLISLCTIWIVSVLCEQRIKDIKWNKSLGGILLLVFAIYSSIIRYKYSYYFIIPIVLLLTIGEISKEKIDEQIDNIAVSLYVVFSVLMTISLIFSPAKGNDGRYEGIFYFPVVTGLLSAMGLISAVYFLTKILKNNNNAMLFSKRKRIVLTVLMVIYPIITLMYSGDRSVLLGVGVILIVVLIYLIGKCSKTIKILASIFALTFLVAGITLTVWASKNFDLDAYVEEHDVTPDDIGYYFIKHLPSIRETNSTGVFEPGTVWASIDAMSSDRLGIWVTGLKKVTLFGKNDLSIVLPTGEDAGHIHSTYIYWLLNYGLIGGVLGIAWMLFMFADGVRTFFKEKEHYMLPTFFVMLAFGMFFVEKQTFEEFLPMLMIIWGYRYFYNLDGYER